MTDQPRNEPPRSQDGWAVLDLPLDSQPPGRILTEADEVGSSGRPDEWPSGPPTPPTGPPGGRTFSLEGRPAAGLYLVGWLFSIGGIAILFVRGLFATSEGVSTSAASASLVALLGVIVLGLGLAAAAGYQVVARGQTRNAEQYRGPSPLIGFGITLVVGTLLGLLFAIVGASPARDDSVGFLAKLVPVAVSYVIVVWLFVVRIGAMSWRGMGWPVGLSLGRAFENLAVGVLVAVPSLVVISLAAVAVSAVLGGVKAPNIVPPGHGPLDLAILAIGTILVAPIGEELFFRGYALTAWWRDLGVRSALIRSALFFGIIHIVNISDVDFGTALRQVVLVLVQIIPLGFVLGWLFVRRGILASIGAHAMYNAVIFFAALVVTQGGS